MLALAIGALVVSSDEVGVLRPLRLVRIVPWLALFPAVAISIMRWRRAAQMQTQLLRLRKLRVRVPLRLQRLTKMKVQSLP